MEKDIKAHTFTVTASCCCCNYFASSKCLSPLPTIMQTMRYMHVCTQSSCQVASYFLEKGTASWFMHIYTRSHFGRRCRLICSRTSRQILWQLTDHLRGWSNLRSPEKFVPYGRFLSILRACVRYLQFLESRTLTPPLSPPTPVKQSTMTYLYTIKIKPNLYK